MATLANLFLDGPERSGHIYISGELDGAKYHIWLDRTTLLPVDDVMYKNDSRRAGGHGTKAVRQLSQSEGIGAKITPQMLAAAKAQFPFFQARCKQAIENQEAQLRQQQSDQRLRDAAGDLLEACRLAAANRVNSNTTIDTLRRAIAKATGEKYQELDRA